MDKQETGKSKLRAAVDRDLKDGGFHDYEAKFQWIIKRAENYAEKTGLSADDILDAWENDRTYWYMNYYQESNQPEIKDDNVRLFETLQNLIDSVGNKGFRCPNCGGVTKNPYECDTQIEVSGKTCNWKSYGLFGTMGKGATVFVKEKIRVDTLFMPIAWETE